MTYIFDFLLNGGATGITDLRAQLIDSTGAAVGSAIATGFVEIGSNLYLWHAAAIPNGHRGAVKWYSNASPLVVLDSQAINPEINEAAATNWAYTARTLTQSAAQVAALIEGSTIVVQRGDTLSIALTGLGSLSGYTSLDFTVKEATHDADIDAVLCIRKNASGSGDGLLILNGSGSVTAGDGSITIDDAALGNITIALLAADTRLFLPNNCIYDVQMIDASGVSTLRQGTFIIQADVRRAIA